MQKAVRQVPAGSRVPQSRKVDHTGVAGSILSCPNDRYYAMQALIGSCNPIARVQSQRGLPVHGQREE